MLHCIPPGILSFSSGFIIEGSGLFDGSSGVLKRTFGTPTINNVWTFETIAKVPDGTTPTTQKLLDCTGSATTQASVTLDSGGQLRCFDYTGSFTWDIQASALSRDPASYYVWTVVVDTRAAVAAADRVKLYQNGVRLTDYAAQTNPANDAVSRMNSAVEHNTSMRNDTSTNIFHGYRARDVFIDGLALSPTSFGEVTEDGYWQINDASGLTFGNNGFLLEGGVNISRGTDTQAGGTFAQQKTEFLSHFDGSDAATSSTDVSLAARTLTFNGNAQLDTAQKYFGTASLLLDGTADSVSAADNPAYDIAALDFTMDAWIRLASDASGVIMSKWGVSGQRGWLFSYDADNSNLDWRTSTNGSNNANQVNETWNPDADTWYHVAAERTGGKVHLYVDGTMLGSGTSNSDNVYANTAKFEVGSCENTGALTFNGHIDEPRYVRGVGLYGGSNFTPETAAYTNPATANPFIVTGTITATNDSPTNGDAS